MKREIPKVIIAEKASMNDSVKLREMKVIIWTINKLIDETDRLTQESEALKKEIEILKEGKKQ